MRKLLSGKSESIFIFIQSVWRRYSFLIVPPAINVEYISCIVMRKLLIIFVILFVCFAAKGQSSGENSLHPSTTKFPSKKEISKRERTALKPKTTVDLQQEYYERVEAVMKARKKAARQMEKPQYSDPRYFGHKRPPKKRSPERMRFCKECGIRH